jgi:molybdate transport system ATP-binding protein
MSIVLNEVVLPLADFELDVSFEAVSRATALLGASGAGKTTVLELIAGLRKPARGSIVLNGRIVEGNGRSIPTRKRRIGYVPQDDALFPHLSVRGNILYGAAGHELSEVIAILDIENLLDRRINTLSGGERKRVAIARALQAAPEVLLLDEPLAGIDAPLRSRVLDYLIRIRETIPIPTIYVTHQHEEAALLCEEIIEIERGRIKR